VSFRYVQWSNSAWGNSAWAGFLGVFAVYYAALAFGAGIKGDNLWFDTDSMLSAAYAFSAAKSHSQVKRLRRRHNND
jgi:hypothetical protein